MSLRMRHTLVIIGLCLLTTPAWATTFSWTMQSIGSQGQTYYGDQLSLVMGRGQVWPSVFYYNGQTLNVASSTPVGWLNTSMGSMVPDSYRPPLRATARRDGGTAVVRRTSTGYTLSESTRTGWQSTTFNAPNNYGNPDLAYNSYNRAVVAYSDSDNAKLSSFDGNAWTTENIEVQGWTLQGDRISMALDSYDDVGMAVSTGYGVSFAMKDSVSGQWNRYVAPQGQQNVLDQLSNVDNISLAYGPNDLPAMLVSNNGQLNYAWFDIRSGSWHSETILQQGAMGSSLSELVYDNYGVPCFVYADTSSNGNNIHYRRRVGYGWQDIVVPARAIGQAGVSLAFDFENLPVIAFHRDGDPYGLALAYDPIEVPEPASILLLGLAGCLIRRRGN